MPNQTMHHIPVFGNPILPSATPELTLLEHGKKIGSPDQHIEQLEQIGEHRTQFRSKAKASQAELFYDLFFVANLTVYTYSHHINDSSSLAQHVGFFCILW